MPATTEVQPKTTVVEEAYGTEMTDPDQAGGPQFIENKVDNEDIYRYMYVQTFGRNLKTNITE